jgi:hypothetical protein
VSDNEAQPEGPTREQLIAEIERLTVQMQQAVAALNQVTTAVQVFPGPDGKLRMAVMFQVGGLATQIQMELDNAPGFADHIHRQINGKVVEARRASSGLLLADPSQLPKLGPLPGGG